MNIIQLGDRYRIKDCLPHTSNFWIDVDPERREINIPATGDIGLSSADDLICAIRYAIDLITGRPLTKWICKSDGTVTTK